MHLALEKTQQVFEQRVEVEEFEVTGYGAGIG